MANSCLYRIAATEGGLDTGYFVAMGLPPPNLITFEPYSTRRPASQGGESRQGYLSCSVLWNRLDSIQANALYEIIATAENSDGEGNATMWMTIPRADASAPGINWIDVSGIIRMPNFETDPGANGLMYPNVIVSLNDVTVENEPSNIFD